jgi:hypothetical protein
VVSTQVALCALLAFAWPLLGCGGPAFELAGARAFARPLPDDHGASMARLRRSMLRRGQPKAPRPSVRVALGTPPGRRRLEGLLLDGSRRLWTLQRRVTTMVVLEHVAVVYGDGEVFAVDLESGWILSRRRVGPVELIGASDDGRNTVVTLGYVEAGGSVLLAFNRESEVIRQTENEARFGAPALLDGVVYVPFWGNQLGALDLDTGAELARMTLPFAVNAAFTRLGVLYAGDTRLLRVDAEIASNPHYVEHKPAFPDVAWSLLPESIVPRRAPRDGVRPRMFVSVRPNAPYVTSYREAITGFVPSGKPSWSLLLPEELLAGEAEAREFLACTAQGLVVRVFRDGQVLQEASFGHPLIDCALRSEEQFAFITTPPALAFDSVMQSPRPELAPLQRFLSPPREPTQ